MLGSYLLEACSFPMKGRKGVDPEEMWGRMELEEIEGGQPVIILYYMRKETIFNIRKKWTCYKTFPKEI